MAYWLQAKVSSIASGKSAIVWAHLRKRNFDCFVFSDRAITGKLTHVMILKCCHLSHNQVQQEKHTYNSITRYKWDLSSNTSLSCTIFGWDNLQQNQKRGGREGRAHARERKAKKEKRISKASEEYIPRTAGLYRYSVTCIQLTLQRPA